MESYKLKDKKDTHIYCEVFFTFNILLFLISCIIQIFNIILITVNYNYHNNSKFYSSYNLDNTAFLCLICNTLHDMSNFI